MAKRRKYEFKPDKTERSLWGKLYLTKKQRLNLAKWSLYTLVLLALSLLQDVVLCRLSLPANADLVPAAIILVTVLLGTHDGCVFALVSSSLFQFSGAGPGYHAIALLTGLSIAGAMIRQSYLRKGFSAAMLCSAATVLLYELVIFFISMILGQTALFRVGTTLLTGGLSALILPILYPIFLSIEKIGGETWKE